jgi:ribosomal protein S18 acetylase RimI-like enzyme
MTGGPAGFLIRPAREADLDAIAAFEIDIARASFGDEAIEDPALHRKRVAAALGKPGELTLVAVAVQEDGEAGQEDGEAAQEDGEAGQADGEGGMERRAGGGAVPVGWAWLSGRTNSLTGARYGNFRSLATADVPGRGAIAELLMTAVLRAAAGAGYTHLTGKTHASNLGMRALYRKHGFEATHLTMEWRPGPSAAGAPGGETDR